MENICLRHSLTFCLLYHAIPVSVTVRIRIATATISIDLTIMKIVITKVKLFWPNAYI